MTNQARTGWKTLASLISMMALIGGCISLPVLFIYSFGEAFIGATGNKAGELLASVVLGLTAYVTSIVWMIGGKRRHPISRAMHGLVSLLAVLALIEVFADSYLMRVHAVAGASALHCMSLLVLTLLGPTGYVGLGKITTSEMPKG